MKAWQWVALGFLNAILLVLGFIFPAEAGHPGFWWNSIPLFYMLYGFVGCVAIVAVAKLFGKFLLQKKENYYDVE